MLNPKDVTALQGVDLTIAMECFANKRYFFLLAFIQISSGILSFQDWLVSMVQRII